MGGLQLFLAGSTQHGQKRTWMDRVKAGLLEKQFNLASRIKHPNLTQKSTSRGAGGQSRHRKSLNR